MSVFWFDLKIIWSETTGKLCFLTLAEKVIIRTDEKLKTHKRVCLNIWVLKEVKNSLNTISVGNKIEKKT